MSIFRKKEKKRSEKRLKPSSSKKSKNSKLKSIKGIIKNPRTSKTFGLLLIMLSIFMLVAFISYLVTWKVDQDLFSLGFWKSLSSDVVVENWLGKLGAFLSHAFIHKGFGLASFAFLGLVFFSGTKLLLNFTPWSIGRIFRYTLLAVLWMSVCITFLFGGAELNVGGTYGYAVVSWLRGAIGGFGTGAAIITSIAVYIIIKFDPNMNALIGLLNKFGSKTKELENEEEVVFADSGNITPEPIVATELELPNEEAESVPEVIDLGTFTGEETEQTKEETPLTTEVVETLEEEGFSVEVAQDDTELLSDKEIDRKLQEFGEYDPKLDLSSYELPKVELLDEHNQGDAQVSKDELEENKNRIVETLANYKIAIAKIKATIGPTVTLYEIIPAAGVRISKIKNLEDDIALSLAALGIRIIAPIPGKGTIGIEVPNKNPQTVSMRQVISSDKFQNTDMELPIALGKTISNETFVFDLTKMPHLLMAGATGQGKSVGLNAILISLLYKKHPSQIKFVLVDPKKVELTLFNKIERHFLAKLPDSEDAIITDVKKVVNTLNSLCIEMDERYDLLKDAQVRNIKEYNAKFIKRRLSPENGHKFLPYIVLVVDEFADLIMTAGKEVEAPIARLAQLARAIGIHLIIATQRPSVNIITGTIKANFPARVAFRVTSKIDSRTILDAGGADQLIGRGDMLLSTGSSLIRLQCAFVDTPEVDKITEFIGAQRAYSSAHLLPEYVDESAEGSTIDDGDRDVMFEDAARMIVLHQQGSTSLLQRKLKLGYNRAGRIIDQLEAAGIIGQFEGSKARKVLIPDEHSLEQLLNRNTEVEQS